MDTTRGGAGRAESEADGPGSRELTVLRVATDLYPEITGGGAIHAHAMSERQAAWGHDVTVFTSDHGDRGLPRVERRDGYTVVRNRELLRPFDNSLTPGVARSLWRRLPDADVLHAHSHLYFATNVAAALGRVADAPLVVTNHGLVSQTAPRWLQRLFIPTVARATFEAADRVLCYTETDRRRLRDRGVRTPVEVIDNGIDCRRFSPPEASDRRRRAVLFVGRLKDAKGVPTLIGAFARLADRYPDLELRIVGEGPERDRYERRCGELGVRDRVTFAGDVPYAEMPEQYRRCQVFVLPSHNEGLPRTVLEAMASGTPVVTTALEQLEPLVDGSGAGYTVERGSVDGVADAVATLLEDRSERRERGRAGRERVVENNAWTRTVARTTELCLQLARR